LGISISCIIIKKSFKAIVPEHAAGSTPANKATKQLADFMETSTAEVTVESYSVLLFLQCSWHGQSVDESGL